MDKQRRSRYVLAVYLIVLSLAVILVLVGLFFTTSPDWKSVWINLGTGLLGVAALFFLVQRFFLADEWGLSDRIEQLVRRLELAERPSAEEFFTKLPDLDPHIRYASQIDMCGVTLTSAINKHYGIIRERLQKGATVRLLIVDPDSRALEMSALRSESPDADYYGKRLEATFNDLHSLCRSLQYFRQGQQTAPLTGTIEVRLLPFAPSFGIYKFSNDQDNGTVLVEIFPHKSGFVSVPAFALVPERDGKWYSYFVDQFEDMWQSANPWDPNASAKAQDFEQLLRQGGVDRVTADQFFFKKPLTRLLPDSMLENANIICLSGMTLIRTTRELMTPLVDRLIAGASIRIMILDPVESVLEELTKRSYHETDNANWQRSLATVQARIENIGKAPDCQGTLQLGRLPYIPSFGFLMVDPDTAHGLILVEIYHHRSADDNPTFLLRASEDSEWYKFFRQQYEILWNSCRIETLSERSRIETA